MKTILHLLAAFAVAGITAQVSEPPVIGGLERAGAEKVAGAVLVSELGCAACHGTDQAAFAAKGGPDLSAVGARV